MSMMPKSAERFSDHVMLWNIGSMMPKSGERFSDHIECRKREPNDA
jgi:hypothetical protein